MAQMQVSLRTVVLLVTTTSSEIKCRRYLLLECLLWWLVLELRVRLIVSNFVVVLELVQVYSMMMLSQKMLVTIDLGFVVEVELIVLLDLLDW